MILEQVKRGKNAVFSNFIQNKKAQSNWAFLEIF